MAHEIIHLISSPRTISTAIMYAFAQHSEVIVLDEPFYGIYLQDHGHNHPGRQKIMGAMPTAIPEVMKKITLLACENRVFIKNMASHCFALDLTFTANYKHLFLIRNPRQIIRSFSAVVQKPTQLDIGIKAQVDLFQQLKNEDYAPLVLESTELTSAPDKLLRKLCAKLELEFEESMLQWPVGPKSCDGVWANDWYGALHKTTKFIHTTEKEISIPKHLSSIHEEAQYYYQQLLSYAL